MTQMAQLESAVGAAMGTPLARSTQAAYSSAWRAWTTFLAERGRAVTQATEADVRAWVQAMRAAGRLESTVGARVAACRAMAGRLAGGAAIFAAAPRVKTGWRSGPLPRLSASQVRRLLDGINRSTASGARDYALFALLLATYARADTVLRLRVGDVVSTSLTQATVHLGGGESLSIPHWVYDAVQAYLQLAGRGRAAADEYLWLPLAGGSTAVDVPAARPISVAAVNKRLRDWLEAAGVETPERYSTSSLRTYGRVR